MHACRAGHVSSTDVNKASERGSLGVARGSRPGKEDADAKNDAVAPDYI
jgi:hypothetical protein